ALGRLHAVLTRALADLGRDVLALLRALRDHLLYHVERLLHLLDAADEPGVVVALAARDDVPPDLLIDRVERLVAPEVPIHAAPSEHRAAAPVGERLVLREFAHADEAELDDIIVQEQVLVLVDALAHVAHVARALVEPVRGQIVLHATDAEPVVREARAGEALHQGDRAFPVADGPPEDGDRAQVQAEG